MSRLRQRVGWISALLLAMIACDATVASAQVLTSEALREVINSQRRVLQQEVRKQLRQTEPGRQGQQPVLSNESVLSERPKIPRLMPGATVVIRFGDGGHVKTKELLNQENPYRLDDSGFLHLPGFPPVHLAGLDTDQAVVRLRAEPALSDVGVSMTLLPLDPRGVDALKRFGYDLFRNARTTFAPATDVPVPVDYVIGPGDNINLQLFGNRNAEYELVVDRDGVINFPEIGPVSVAGLSFESLRREVALRVTEGMIGVRVSVTLGELRAIRVFVLGDVKRPGRYTVSGLSTVTNALFISGGIRKIGSLRRIEIRRNGHTVSTLDLYDLLLRGDTRGDVRLKPGDVVFVPPAGHTVAVYGEVTRPAIYEIRGKITVADAVALAGGALATADTTSVKVTRMDPEGISVRQVGWESTDRETIENGDIVQVPPRLDQLHHSIRLSGHVQQPGLYQWRPGMSLTDLFPTAEALKPEADLHYVLIRRQLRPNGRIDVLSADLEAGWRMPRTAADVMLLARDTVHVFPRGPVGRAHVMDKLWKEVRLQLGSDELPPVVWVGGRVKAPGRYLIEKGMRVSDLIRAGGGLYTGAYKIDAEMTRYRIVGNKYRQTSVIKVDLAGVLAGDPAADILIRPHDRLRIETVVHWQWGEDTVSARGEVNFPGNYSIRRNERLSSLLRRAGGLTDHAFPEGALLLRRELRDRENRNIQLLADRLERDLASSALASAEGVERLATGEALLTRIRSTRPSGRMVIDLPAILAGNSEKDVVLKDGDQLLIPVISQEVTVFGEVQRSTSHLYDPDLNRDDYIRKSGGVSAKADKARIYIVRASGDVVASSAASRFFMRSNSTEIRPGDSIVVPLDTDRVAPIRIWSTIAGLVQNLALTAAAVNSVIITN